MMTTMMGTVVAAVIATEAMMTTCMVTKSRIFKAL